MFQGDIVCLPKIIRIQSRQSLCFYFSAAIIYFCVTMENKNVMISNPHDLFFKSTFSEKNNAANTTKMKIDYIIEEAGKISPQLRRNTMTTAELLRKEGRKEGLAKSRIEIAEKMLRSGYSKEEISKLTGINPDELSGKSAAPRNNGKVRH